ncbi:MAG TPA: ribose-5-phosphate isomerase RpiA [Chloroflexota bacterium]|nr:ribose-5-phosphate isomerase RpiA [Chloroflexota bacterium]
MTKQSGDPAGMKQRAATYAAELVEDGMVVGLGSGTTATLLVQALAVRAREGLRFEGVATSEATASLAASLRMPIFSLDDRPHLDLAIDGADEVDPALNLIKGLGGALLREKLVASSAARFVIVVDDRKLVDRLGDHSPVPVEVVRFGWTRARDALDALGGRVERRMAGEIPFLTDGENFILDCWFDPNADVAALGLPIKAITGVVDHGLFIAMTEQVVVGHPDRVDVLRR